MLDGVDLTVEPGEHLAVVGESGSGKSTLLSVLLGFTDPDDGTVWVGAERPGATARLREWRRQVAWVPQRPYLVRGTLEDNLRLGNPRRHRGRGGPGRRALPASTDWWPACRTGLDTPVGEGGLTLSAGERQRIAIGRAVLRDVPVVLLDEPTAHLDAAREDSLRTALEPWLEGRTVVMAAHRGGLVGRVDRTVTLVAGRPVEPAPARGRSS